MVVFPNRNVVQHIHAQHSVNARFAKVFDPVSFYLKNGLHIVVVSDRRAPAVSHMLWYKVGSADDPKGKSGLAHFVEHLMFKGTKRYKPGQASKIISKILPERSPNVSGRASEGFFEASPGLPRSVSRRKM